MLPRVLRTSSIVALALALFATRAPAATYTVSTPFAGGAHMHGNMFDVTTFNDPIRITSLDIRTRNSAGSKTLHVYTRPGSYQGHEGSAAGWTLHSMVPAIAGLGPDYLTPVDIHDLYLPGGTTTGLYVTLEAMSPTENGHLRYNNSGSAESYTGDVNGSSALRLDLGAGVAYPFGGTDASSPYAPRIWNGTVHYDVLDAIPQPQPHGQIFIDAGRGVMFGPESKWNTIHATMAGASVALYDPVGVPTGVTATLSSGWTNTTTTGQTGAYAGTILAEATADYLYVTSENTSATLTLDGLADAWYRVEMSASRSDSSNRLQNTTLNGAWADGDHSGQNFNAFTHGHQQGNILLWRARPSDGSLTLEVSREEPFGYLNALIITQLPEPQPKIYIDAGNRNVFSAYDKWNTVHADMTGPITLYDPDGIPIGATLTIDGDWNNLTDTASQTGAYANTHPILAEASSDNIWLGSTSEAQTGTLTFEGLPTPESWQWYRFEMACSRSQQALPRSQDVTINGLWADGDDHAGQSFNAYTDGFLAGTVLTWDSVIPDENGLVTLTFSTGTNQFGYLNAMVITLVPEPSTALLLALGGLSVTLRRRRRKPHLRSGISHGDDVNADCDPRTPRQAEHRPSAYVLSQVLLAAVVVATAVPCARAADYSLTTLYNPTAHERGNMFDVTTFDHPVQITSLDIHTQDTVANRTLRVYTRPGTYVGHESNSEGWTLHSVVPGIAGMGHNTPTPVNIHDLYLPAGTTTGLYVTFESGNLAYTNPAQAPGTATTYGGPANHLQLDLGVGLGYPFGPVYSPRVWNGTFHYDLLDAIPEPQPKIFIDGGNGVVFGPDSKWNTIHAGMAGVPVAMHDPAGVPTGVTATLNQWTNSSTIGQTGEFANTHPVLAEATDDYMFVTGAGNTGTLTLEGLADTWYRVEMSASRNLGSHQVWQNTTLNGAWADGAHTGQDFNARTDGFDKGTVLLWRARPTDGVLTLEVSRNDPDAYLNALIVTQLPSEPQPRIFIDGGNANVFGVEDKWNTIHADMTGPIALYDPAGVPTGVTVTLDGEWRNSTADDCMGAFEGTILAEATDDFIWIHSSQPSGVGATLTFEGLEPESWQWYRFEMSASRSTDAYTRRQDVTLNGEWPDGPDHNGQNFNAYTDGFLAGKMLSWDNVRPDENGLITLTVTRKNGDAYLNALVITLVPEPSTALLLVFGGLSLALRRRRRKIDLRYGI